MSQYAEERIHPPLILGPFHCEETQDTIQIVRVHGNLPFSNDHSACIGNDLDQQDRFLRPDDHCQWHSGFLEVKDLEKDVEKTHHQGKSFESVQRPVRSHVLRIDPLFVIPEEIVTVKR